MLLEFWFNALRAKVGIIVKTDQVERLRQKLYQERAAYEGTELNDLFLAVPAGTVNELWIVHKRIKPDAEEI